MTYEEALNNLFTYAVLSGYTTSGKWNFCKDMKDIINNCITAIKIIKDKK